MSAKFKVNRENRLCWPHFVCLIVLLNSFVVLNSKEAVAASNPDVDMIEGENRRLGVTVVKKSLSEKRQTQNGDLGDLDSPAAISSIDSELDSFDGGKIEEDSSSASQEVPIESLISKDEALFQSDALSPKHLAQMDCHMRNIDYCYAGLMAASTHLLPENDDEFEVRCDELKAATSCVAVFNQRCQTLKVFAAFGPILGNGETNEVIPQELREMPIAPAAEELLLNEDGRQQTSNNNKNVEVKNSDIINICQPSAKGTKANRLLRQRIFQIGKCVNQRLPKLMPCIDDLKTALQLIYEPTRSLPLKPTCCAVTRFRACSIDALDNVCGLNSFSEFEKSFSSFTGGNMFKSLDRVCKQSTKLYDSYHCSDLLPPSGMKISQRTGRKASKLARALNLLQFAPAVSQTASNSP